MIPFERSRTIDAPAERVYASFVDYKRWLAWVPHFSALTPLSEGPLAPGFRFRVIVKPYPFSSVWEVTEVCRGRSFAWANNSVPGFSLTVNHIAEAIGDGSHVTMRVDIAGPLAPVLSPFVEYSMRNFEAALAGLERMLAEDGGAND